MYLFCIFCNCKDKILGHAWLDANLNRLCAQSSFHRICNKILCSCCPLQFWISCAKYHVSSCNVDSKLQFDCTFDHKFGKSKVFLSYGSVCVDLGWRRVQIFDGKIDKCTLLNLDAVWHGFLNLIFCKKICHIEGKNEVVFLHVHVHCDISTD